MNSAGILLVVVGLALAAYELYIGVSNRNDVNTQWAQFGLGIGIILIILGIALFSIAHFSVRREPKK
jgi:uncharacterized membrane protein